MQDRGRPLAEVSCCVWHILLRARVEDALLGKLRVLWSVGNLLLVRREMTLPPLVEKVLAQPEIDFANNYRKDEA